MPRYNLRTLRGERVIKKKEGGRIQRWESNYKRLIKNTRNVLSLEEVVEEISQTFVNNAIEQEKISLICPLSKTRIRVPARYRNCLHLQCFDLKSFLAMKTKINFLNCPICNIVVDNELDGLCIDKYFQNILSNISGATEIDILGDGTFRMAPSHSAPIIPKVIDDEGPYAPLTAEVKSETNSNVGDIEELSSVSSYDIDNEANTCDAETQNLQVPDTSMACDTNHAARSNNAESGSKIDEKRLNCGHCSYCTNNSESLLKHGRTQTRQKAYKCDQCSYVCASANILEKHMRTHTNETPFKCTQCPYASITADALKNHMRMRTHTGKKPHKCGLCWYTFAHANDLAKHMRTHTGEKPYKCKKCSYASAQSGTLKAHMRTHF